MQQQQLRPPAAAIRCARGYPHLLQQQATLPACLLTICLTRALTVILTSICGSLCQHLAVAAAHSGTLSPALTGQSDHLCRAHMRQHAWRQPDTPRSPTTCPARIIISCTSWRAGLKFLWLMTQVTAAPGAWASRTLRLASGRSTSAAPFSLRQRHRASAACRQRTASDWCSWTA